MPNILPEHAPGKPAGGKVSEDAKDTSGDINYGIIPGPYHTHNGLDSPIISLGAHVHKLAAGTAIVVSPSSGFGNVTVSSTGVTALTAGTNVTVSNGTGNVTISVSSSSPSLASRNHISKATLVSSGSSNVVVQSIPLAAMGANDTLQINVQAGANQAWQAADRIALRTAQGTFITISPLTANAQLSFIAYVYNTNSTASQDNFTVGAYGGTSADRWGATTVQTNAVGTLDLVVDIPGADAGKTITVYALDSIIWKG